ncbi:MAG: hypothetical protein L3J29_08025 [Cyclobacteriaceae bacterium]|nr:hypothetical protein [Cyclobacteriaceae bacterium]
MKKPELIFVGVIFLVACYFVFSYATRKKEFNNWDLVTSNAAIVYESNSLITTWNNVTESDLWNSVSNIKEINQINETLQLIDTLSGGNGQLSSLFNNHNAIISAHVTSQQTYGLTYFIPLGTSGHTLYLNFLVNLEKHKKLKRSQRVYQAQTIYELALNDTNISYIVYKNTLVFSTEAFLVEDVVRNIKNEFKENFIRSYPSLSGNPSFATDDGNLYINGTEVSLFANSFLNVKNRLDGSTSLAGSIFFDITLSDKGLFASGFAYDNGSLSLVSTFKNQQAVEFNLRKLIPKNTAIIEHFGTTDLNKWYSNWVRLHKTKMLDHEQGAKFVKFLTNELAHLTLQSVDDNHLNKLFIAEIADVAGLYNHLNKIAEKQITQTSDSLYIENYAGQEIRLIDNESILHTYFGFEGFSSTYYLIFNNHLVVANTAETLRNWLVQVENELVWSKSVRMNSFFKNALTEANYTYVTNLEYSWNLQYDKLNGPLKKWTNANASTLKEFNMLAFQISNLDNRYYANFHINYAPVPQVIAEKRVFDVSTIQLANRVAIKPKVVKNHKTGQREILVQDSLTNLVLIGANGDVLWSDSLGVALKGEMYQIDFYKNSKLQYLVHSDSTLFLIDRKGNSVEGYPMRFNYAINKVYLIDYDRSKNYRILISDHFGNLRMYDKHGKNLEGWAPNEFGSNFGKDIIHIRVRGKDRILIPLAKGEVHLTNRRGEEMEDFPLDIGVNISNKFFVSIGESFDDTQFTTVSEDGLVIPFTMAGKMLSRNQLFKESDQSKFELIEESQGKDYVYVRNDLNRLAIVSVDGDVLFEKDFPGISERQVQYYNFGSDRKLFVVKSNENIYLYNQTGELLNLLPLISEFPISIVYIGNENACHLYLAHENTIELKKIYF